ncbi:hypothetical protein JTE90_010164 [Oedothorax gibbosus]|uniref:SUEL-type lectin domain-containing protein n=1 Tax=Oedothorax gibbosus TaxID=931172 RepID=A0AAV6TYU6_9ARAC|nr:hypothetical protein JTE90_010164 [Oedothorax gibbosus]
MRGIVFHQKMDTNLLLLHLGLLFCLVLGVLGRAEDEYGLWHRTLTPFQAHACDGEALQLECTPSTVISVHYVSYGRQVNAGHLCPGSATRGAAAHCDSSKGALQVIHRRCHKSTNCRVLITPSLFGVDNCPGARKFIEVVYKCRPDCLIAQSDETIRSLCSGRQNCSLMADDRTFGNPGCRQGNKYLKIAYNCVEKELLLPNVRRSEDYSIVTTSFPAWASGLDLSAGHSFRPRGVSDTTTDSSSRTSSSDMQSDEVPADYRRDPTSLSGNQEVVGFMSDWVAAHKHMKGNKDKLILYLSISLAVGFVACISVLAGRYVIIRLESRRSSRADISANHLEDPFLGEHVLDHYDPPRVDTPPPPPPLPSTSSFRKDSEVLPRAPVNTGSDLNHYFG